MTREQIDTISPQTLAFPELVTPLDAEIVVSIAKRLPALNLDGEGWQLRYCRELDADRDSWRFKVAEELAALGATREGLYWSGPDEREWWPLVEGTLFYNLEFPMAGKEPKYWVNGGEVRSIHGRQNDDGTSVMDHWRVAWRDVARSVDVRTCIATVLPPRCAAKDKAPTIWGGSRSNLEVFELAGLMSSFCFDYLVRFRGATSLKYGQINSVPAPTSRGLGAIAHLVEELTTGSCTDLWSIAEARANIDAGVALAYGLGIREYTAVLCSFPLLDRAQPMLPGEPKSFVTRDLALFTLACELGQRSCDIAEALNLAGIELPPPRSNLRRLDERVARYREMGAIPYRPTPKGGRPPTDPALIDAVTEVLSRSHRPPKLLPRFSRRTRRSIKKVLESLVKSDDCLAQGRGRTRSYYVIEE